MKAVGGRLPACSTPAFAKAVAAHVPALLEAALTPVLELIRELSGKIKALDREIERMAEEEYPETRHLTQITGVGALTALCYVLVLEDPKRVKQSRSVGAYLGLTPQADQSGEWSIQRGIAKSRDALLRRLLVSSAHYILGPFGPDTDLRRWGLQLACRGGKGAKKRAVVAVARKLAVLLHALWKSGGRYEPLRQSLAYAA